MEIGRDLLAAIGMVVIEATNLESTLAGLVSKRWGWDGEQEMAMMATPGAVRRYLRQLVTADPGWNGMRALKEEACSLLDQRNELVHSVVVYVHDEDDKLRGIELWHARNKTVRELPTVGDIARLASELNHCALGAIMSLSEAEDRFAKLGGTGAPSPDGLGTA
jgi:hypothetical protein